MVVFLGLVRCNSKSLTTNRLVFLVFIFVGGVSDNILHMEDEVGGSKLLKAQGWEECGIGSK